MGYVKIRYSTIRPQIKRIGHVRRALRSVTRVVIDTLRVGVIRHKGKVAAETPFKTRLQSVITGVPGGQRSDYGTEIGVESPLLRVAHRGSRYKNSGIRLDISAQMGAFRTNVGKPRHVVRTELVLQS